MAYAPRKRGDRLKAFGARLVQIGTLPKRRGAALKDHAPHLFLSHSSNDSVWVSKLARELNVCGVDVWFDAWELRAGDDLHERITEGWRNRNSSA